MMPTRRPLGAALALTVTLSLASLHASGPAAAGPTDTARIKIATGSNHSVVVRADGVPYATGRGVDGEITGTLNRRTLTPMTGLPHGVRAVDVSTAGAHTLVLGSNGQVYGTGRNSNGQLTGSGNRSTLTPLTGLPSGARAVAISTGGDSSLVLADNGLAYGTGRNTQNQLTGTGDRSTLTVLTGLPSGVTATAVTTGGYHSLVIGSDGILYGAGSNSTGQLTGGGNRTTLGALTGMPAGVSARAIAAGEQHSLMIGSDGKAYGTGRGDEGQLTGTADRAAFTVMTGLPSSADASAIAAGNFFSLVLSSKSTAYGTGDNTHGQLTGTGNRSTLTALVPATLLGQSTEIAAGKSGSLVRTRDGIVHGMGNNFTGELTGASTASLVSATPLTGQVIAAVTRPRISAGPYVGGTTRVSIGTWAPDPTAYSYQWRRSGTPIGGARAATYRPKSKDIGKRLTVTVTARRAGVTSGSALTSQSARVLRAPLRYTARKKPAISGTVRVGRTLRITHLTRSGWAPDATRHAYQWYRGSTKITRATRSTYRIRTSDHGEQIRVRIIGMRSGYQPGRYTTKKTSTVRRR